MSPTFTMPLKIDVIGITKDGRKFAMFNIDVSKDIDYIERHKHEKDRYVKEAGYLMLTNLNTSTPMELLRELVKTNKELKDIKIVIFSIPKEQAEYKIPDGKTVLQIANDKIQNTLKYVWTEDIMELRPKEMKFPFKVEVKVV